MDRQEAVKLVLTAAGAEYASPYMAKLMPLLRIVVRLVSETGRLAQAMTGHAEDEKVPEDKWPYTTIRELRRIETDLHSWAQPDDNDYNCPDSDILCCWVSRVLQLRVTLSDLEGIFPDLERGGCDRWAHRIGLVREFHNEAQTYLANVDKEWRIGEENRIADRTPEGPSTPTREEKAHQKKTGQEQSKETTAGNNRLPGGIPSQPICQGTRDVDAQSMEWDVFISHASEDKEAFVRPLATALQKKDIRVWFDEFTLTVGDSLRRSIDRGLARSRYGIVVISPDFLKKEWPQKELDGLVAQEADGRKVVLPVWHKVDDKTLRQYSPLLADRVATSTAKGVDAVVADIMKAMK
jgi:hypothetical protein